MAEDTTIPLDGGSDSSSAAEDLDTSPALETPGASPVEDAGPDVSALQAQFAELTRMNEQYKRERRGWEEQSRRNLEEKNAYAERLARLEGQLTGLSQGRGEPPPPQYTPGQMTAALEKYMSGDANAMTQAEQALWATVQQAVQQATQQHNSSALDEEKVNKIILDRLVELGTKGNAKNIVGHNHPDLHNPQSSLARAVWERYDTYTADPGVQLFYPRDPQYEIPWDTPDGSQRLVDVRVLDRLAADIRRETGQQEGRKQEQRAQTIGGAMTGHGQTTRTPVQRSVEAIDLLTEGELAGLHNPFIRKGWSTMPEALRRAQTLSPAELKAAAKFLVDRLPEEVKQERLAQWRHRRGAA